MRSTCKKPTNMAKLKRKRLPETAADQPAPTDARGDGVQALKVIPPKPKSIEQLKRDFFQTLKLTGGNVSRAVEASGLPRRTAYNHLASERAFAEGWHDAVAVGHDRIDAKLTFEALKENPVPSLLIYAHKNATNQKKWRGRLMQAAKLGVEAMQISAVAQGIDVPKIAAMREAMIKAYEKVPLV